MYVTDHTTGLRVLVVEDYEDCATTTAMLLRCYGYDAKICGDGAQALDIARGYKPDVVLLDIGLPGMNGFDVAMHLTRRGGPTPLIVAVTGFGQETDRERSAAAGIHLHLVKPVDPNRLRAILQDVEHEVGH